MVLAQGGAPERVPGPHRGVVLPAAGSQQTCALAARHERDHASQRDGEQPQVLRGGDCQVSFAELILDARALQFRNPSTQGDQAEVSREAMRLLRHNS